MTAFMVFSVFPLEFNVVNTRGFIGKKLWVFNFCFQLLLVGVLTEVVVISA